MNKQMNMPFDLLLGRNTFDIWAPFWPQHADMWPGVMTATTYVASNTLLEYPDGSRVAALRRSLLSSQQY